MGLFTGQSDHSYCKVSPKSYEQVGQHAVTNCEGFRRVEIKNGGLKTLIISISEFPIKLQPMCLGDWIHTGKAGMLFKCDGLTKKDMLSPIFPNTQSPTKSFDRQAMLILLTSEWKTRSWYPQLLKLSIQSPLILPKIPNLLQGPNKKHHLLITKENLRFLACIFSGQDYFQNEYQRSLQLSSQMPDNQVESLNTNFPGINGIANVLGEKLIPLNFL